MIIVLVRSPMLINTGPGQYLVTAWEQHVPMAKCTRLTVNGLSGATYVLSATNADIYAIAGANVRQ
jgi:hypothetical protein